MKSSTESNPYFTFAAPSVGMLPLSRQRLDLFQKWGGIILSEANAMVTKTRLTWDEMVRIEPRLGALLQEIKAVQPKDDDEYFCANEVWVERFKPRVITLVGWDAQLPELQTIRAYDLGYDTCYNALPDCRDCGCLQAHYGEEGRPRLNLY